MLRAKSGLEYIRCVLCVAHRRKMQMDLEREIDRLEKISKRQTFFLATIDVWHPSYRRVKAENDAIEVQLKEAWTALKEHESAERARAAATAAALKREAGVQRAMLECQQRVWYKERGSAYLILAWAAQDPQKRLEAANAAILCFGQYRRLCRVTADVDCLIATAQEVVDTAQKELDKPFYVKWFDYALELLVTG